MKDATIKPKITKILIFITLISVISCVFFFRDQIDFEAIQTWLQGLGY